MHRQRLLELAGQPGHWGYLRTQGLWAQVHTQHGLVSVGDSEPHLSTVGALAPSRHTTTA